ncbi:hypothetical protein AVV36_gp048 [Pectobacterium bacteriophage PM2]|uniref:Nucleotidyl transferase domain-containing protein n=1 Tax=Pectobacterium bacteriophage PM2 TaxID=1429794 RepID=A0A0A0Q2D6_9CAUD|nr:hypothetical protein AVV36_gp048 [Pectobacterium bacteriophage PM2]AHY25010.1 hypothetical protein PM2_048 [Pectobacterium bacteriophage PM2]
MKKVVILGAGLATRLYPITHHIPKVLVNYKQDTILKNLYRIYGDLGAEEIIVVVHSKYTDMVSAYAKQENLDITIRNVDESFGSAYALATLNDDLEGHNVLLNWCDIIPEFNRFQWNQNEIMTFGNQCRYNYKDSIGISNVGRTGGNIVGIYQFKDWEFYMGDSPEEIHENCHGQDFVEYIPAQFFRQNQLRGLTDLGDMPKLEQAHSNREFNRSFNSVEILKDTVKKYALTTQAENLQTDEVNWYYKVESDSIPQIIAHKDNWFEMERIKGVPMFEHLKKLPHKEQKDVIRDIICELSNLSNNELHVGNDVIRRDYKKEFYTKVLGRCEIIQELINSFGEIKYVNGLKIGRLKTMLMQASEHLINYHEYIQGDYYSIIHGDPNFSNTMMSEDNQIKFIDPRGYFGGTKLFGPRLYDEAKVLYAASGYDEFNSDPTWGGLEIKGDSAIVTIKPLVDKFDKMFDFTDCHLLANAIIWIALGGYFKNNPLKAVSAYYYGMYLLTKQLNKMGRLLKDGSISRDVAEPITATLITKNPGKWVLKDLETGVSYRPVGGRNTEQWEAIEP